MGHLELHASDLTHFLLHTFNPIPGMPKHFTFLTKKVHMSNTLVAVRNKDLRIGILHVYDLRLMVDVGHHVGYVLRVGPKYRMEASYLLAYREQFYQQTPARLMKHQQAELRCRLPMVRIFTFGDSAVLVTAAEVPSTVTRFLD